MKKNLDVAKPTQPGGARPALLVGLLVLAGAIVVGMLVLSNGSKTAVHEDQRAAIPAEASQPTPAPDVQSKVASPQPAASAKVEPAAQSPATSTSRTTVVKGPTTEDFIKLFQDSQQPLKARANAAKELVKEGSNSSFLVLRDALRNSRDNNLRSAIAEALGASTHPESAGTLLGLMGDGSEGVAMAAVRALAEQGTPEAVNALSQTLYNDSSPLNVRCEAAVGLGKIDQPGVIDNLSRAASTITDEYIVGSILEALGGRPISETQAFFQSYLRSATVSTEFKVSAIEALGQAKGDPSALLMEVAKDKDPELRAEAAWAMSNTETEGKMGSDLATLLQNEADPDVRRRLFQALGNQESFDVSIVKSMVEKETDASARLAGLDLLAMELRNNPSQDLSSYFDQNSVADLKKLALNGESSTDRIGAVTALKRAGTAASQAALQDIAQRSTDKRVLNATLPKLVKGR